MARPGAIVAALKSLPGGYAPASISGMGRVGPVQAMSQFGGTSYANGYGPFLPRNPNVFTNAAFSPAAPIFPTPIDEAPPGSEYPGPRWWQYRQSWNLPTPPGTEGLKLASFDQLRTLSSKYSVARACIELRCEEIRGLDWNIVLTTAAAKAYRGDNTALKDFGERQAKLMKFFRRPDPDFWNFDSFLNAMLEEIFVFDALSLVFRPKFGASIGMRGRGLLGTDLDSLNLVSGPTIRPLIDIHGGIPAPPDPAYQQFLYGVPRSDYMTIAMGTDIDDAGLAGAEVNHFDTDIMLYAPYWRTRETPYGFPPVERALLPIISGLQKQEFQLDYFTEGTIPAVYISPGDANITPTQIGELQNALNAIAGDPAYHLKVVVLPPGSKVEPQRPVDLSDSFDYLVMNQVCMAFDIQPQELGILPNIGSSQQGPTASAVRFGAETARDIKSRKSTKPLLKFICDVFNYVIQDICDCHDMQFEFEGLVDDEDKQAITSLGVEQIQNGVSSIDEVRERLDMPPWGLQETQEPIVMTQNGPVPFSMAPKLIQAMLTQNSQPSGSSSSSGSSSKKKTAAKPKKGTSATGPKRSNTTPNVAPSRPNPQLTPAHAAAQAQIQTLRPQRGKTGGSAGRTQNAGSRTRGSGLAPTQGRLRNKAAAASELDMLKRHIRKGRLISDWEPEHITSRMLGMIAEDAAKGILLDVACDRALQSAEFEVVREEFPVITKTGQFPGWEHDLGLVGRAKEEISQAFQDAEIRGGQIRKDVATGSMYATAGALHSMIADVTKDVFLGVLTPIWKSAWQLGYDGARALVTGQPVYLTEGSSTTPLEDFIATSGEHWLQKISSTGLGNSNARSDIIARTEVARAMNAGVMQAYKDMAITHKHLLVAPDDTCDICWGAKAEGIIPLDAIFPGGDPPFHPSCRCVAAPANVIAEPPQAHIGKSSHQEAEDPSRVAFLMIRGTDPDGKARYLLQKRTDDTWGLPGGQAHVGEEPFNAAVRESTEEMGDLPPMTPLVEHRHHKDDKTAHIYLCEVPYVFPVLMNGSTPEETTGAGWFRRKEVGSLDLHEPFRKQWESVDWKNVAKHQNQVTQEGQWIVADDDERWGATGGAQWPYPPRTAETPVPSGGSRPGGGQQQGEMGAAEPPRQGPDGRSEQPEARIYPRGSKTPPGKRGKGTPATGKFPSGNEHQDMHPGSGHGDTQIGGASSVKASPRPVVGMRPPETPHPSAGKPITPMPADPGEAVEQWDPEFDSNVTYNLPKPHKKKGSGGPADYSDPNPVDAEHVYVQMAKNFPPEAIAWIKRARWIGPVHVPMDRIDQDDRDKWAASHQVGKVKEFERLIQQHAGHVAPSVLVQEPDTHKAFIVDGHHRALAHENLKQPVLAYIGNIDPKDRQAALETHTHQFHSGADPRNK